MLDISLHNQMLEALPKFSSINTVGDSGRYGQKPYRWAIKLSDHVSYVCLFRPR